MHDLVEDLNNCYINLEIHLTQSHCAETYRTPSEFFVKIIIAILILPNILYAEFWIVTTNETVLANLEILRKIVANNIIKTKIQNDSLLSIVYCLIARHDGVLSLNRYRFQIAKVML